MPPLHHLPPLPPGAHHPHNPFAQHHPQQDVKHVQQPEKKEPHVKKPLNAFMIYMKVIIKSTATQMRNANIDWACVITGAETSCSGWMHPQGVCSHQSNPGQEVEDFLFCDEILKYDIIYQVARSIKRGARRILWARKRRKGAKLEPSPHLEIFDTRIQNNDHHNVNFLRIEDQLMVSGATQPSTSKLEPQGELQVRPLLVDMLIWSKPVNTFARLFRNSKCKSFSVCRQGPKKKKRKIDKEDPTYSMKKCRARYGLEQQQLWSWNRTFSRIFKISFFWKQLCDLVKCRCKPCRRKKKCVRVQMYLQGRYL